MPLYFPFLIDVEGKPASPQMELALAFGQAMQKREETNIPFVRRSGELPTIIAKITWPVLMRRAFASDRYLFFDPTGMLGERMNLPVQPDFSIAYEPVDLRADDSFSTEALRLAQHIATMQPQVYDSHVVTLFAGLGDIVQSERELRSDEQWGAALPIGDEQEQVVRDEQELLLSWLPHFNEEESRFEQALKALREIGAQRIEYYEWQKAKALQLINEEISSLEPQVNQQLGDLKQQHAMMQQQKSALQEKFAELEEQINAYQNEVQAHQGRSQQMVEYYNDCIRRTREEMRYLSEQQTRGEETLLEEVSAQTLLLRRPLTILEQQRQQEERQWQQAINSEHELIKTLTNILHEGKLNFQMAAKELLNRSQVVAPELPDEVRLELPFTVVRLQSITTSRYLVLPPAMLKASGTFSSFFTDLVRGIRFPLSSRSATWDEMARLIEERLNRQQLPDWLYELLQERDLLASETRQEIIEEGIAQLRSGSYLTERMAEQLKAQLEDAIKEERAGAGADR